MTSDDTARHTLILVSGPTLPVVRHAGAGAEGEAVLAPHGFASIWVTLPGRYVFTTTERSRCVEANRRLEARGLTEGPLILTVDVQPTIE